MRNGRRFRTKKLDICWLKSEVGHSRLGVVVPKYGQKAIARNRLKRWLKEIGRRSLLPNLKRVDFVVRTRPSAYRSPFGDLSSELDQWLKFITRSRVFPATE